MLPHIHDACTFGAAHLLFCVKIEDDNNDVHNWKADPTKITNLSHSWVRDIVKPIKQVRISDKTNQDRSKQFDNFVGPVTNNDELIKNLAGHPLGYILQMQQIMASGFLFDLVSRSKLLLSEITPDNVRDIEDHWRTADSRSFRVESGTKLSINLSHDYNLPVFSFGGVKYLVKNHDLEVEVYCNTVRQEDKKFNNYSELLESLATHRINQLKSVMVTTPYGEMSRFEYMHKFMGL